MLHLPELRASVFQYLEKIELVNCALVCGDWYDSATEQLWRAPTWTLKNAKLLVPVLDRQGGTGFLHRVRKLAVEVNADSPPNDKLENRAKLHAQLQDLSAVLRLAQPILSGLTSISLHVSCSRMLLLTNDGIAPAIDWTLECLLIPDARPHVYITLDMETLTYLGGHCLRFWAANVSRITLPGVALLPMPLLQAGLAWLTVRATLDKSVVWFIPDTDFLDLSALHPDSNPENYVHLLESLRRKAPRTPVSKVLLGAGENFTALTHAAESLSLSLPSVAEVVT